VSDIRGLLRIRDFRLLFAGQAMSNWGDSLTSLTLLILTQRYTGSTAAVAGTAIAVALPQLLFGMVAGVYVDRWDRKKVMVGSDVLRGVLVLGFVFFTSADQIWLMYGLAFLQATVGAFFNPAKGAMLPHIVGRERLLAANSTMETSRIIAGLLGTAAAGVYLGVADSVWPIFVIDGLTFASSALFERALVSPSRDAAPAEATGVWHEMTAGIRAAFRSRVLVGVLMSGAVLMLGIGAVNVLLVPFVVGDLGVSETWFGAIEASQVASMVLSGAIVATLASRFRPDRIVAGGMIGVGVGLTAIAAVGSVWQFMLALFAIGWFVTPLQAGVSTIIQSEVPDEMRGRIGAALQTVLQSANVGSMALAGIAAAAIGTRGVFIAAGALAVAGGLIGLVLFRGAVAAPEPAVEPAT
jgi:DHA3 family macrolide efflux protein-like MFS transporter